MINSRCKQYFFLILLFFGSCSTNYQQASDSKAQNKVPDREVSMQLERNRSLWANKGAKNYRFLLYAYIPGQNSPNTPVLVEVHEGKAISIAPTQGKSDIFFELYKNYDTIEKLFDLIQKAIERNPQDLKIEYDQKLGYPTRIFINETSLGDDEFTFRIDKLDINQ